MKKEFLINIRGVYTDSEDSDVIEIFTTGDYYHKDGKYYISYAETEATGFGGSRTTVEIEDNSKITMFRSGNHMAQLVIERGVRHQCHYDTGYGNMMIGVSGQSIKTTLTPHGGDVSFKYSLDVDTLLTSENEMYINIKESAN